MPPLASNPYKAPSAPPRAMAGKEIPSGFSYCPCCGTSLSRLMSSWSGSMARVKYCPYCGSPISCEGDSVTRGKGRLVITKLGGPMAH